MKYLGYFLGVVWSLPLTIATLLLAVFYRPTQVRWKDGCLELIAGRKKDGDGNDHTRIWGKPDGQCLGGIAVWFATLKDANDPELRVHERRHTVQGFTGGLIFFGAVYVLDFLRLLIFLPRREQNQLSWKRWQVAYWSIWFEKDARRHTLQHPNGWGSKL